MQVNTEPTMDKERCEPHPPMGVCVWVQCETFRCIGFVDKSGTWRAVFTGKELPAVSSWETAQA